MTISEEFEYFISESGAPSNRVKVEFADVAQYQDKIPGSLLNFWLDIGWGDYLDGLIKLTDPSLLGPVIPILFSNNRDFRPEDCTIYAYSAFGEIILWHKSYGVMRVNLLSYSLSVLGFLYPEKTADSDAQVALPLCGIEKRHYDAFDEKSVLLYDRACRALGIPASDECFGFFPALPLGGGRVLENLRRVKTREHFSILAQLRPLQLTDFTVVPPRVVREL